MDFPFIEAIIASYPEECRPALKAVLQTALAAGTALVSIATTVIGILWRKISKGSEQSKAEISTLQAEIRSLYNVFTRDRAGAQDGRRDEGSV